MRIVGVVATTAALALMLPGIGRSAPVTVRYMGENSCGAWLATDRDYRSLNRAAALNWVLGHVSGVSQVAGQDLLAGADQASIAAWLDQYCAANPLDGLPRAATVLVNELSARIGARSPFPR